MFSIKWPVVLFSMWDVYCLCTHWVLQNTKLHPFLIHAGSVYTICILFLCFALLMCFAEHGLSLSAGQVKRLLDTALVKCFCWGCMPCPFNCFLGQISARRYKNSSPKWFSLQSLSPFSRQGSFYASTGLFKNRNNPEILLVT
jgi:hypothetical protein